MPAIRQISLRAKPLATSSQIAAALSVEYSMRLSVMGETCPTGTDGPIPARCLWR